MSKKRPTSKPALSQPASKRSRKARKQNRAWVWIGLGIAAILILAAAILLRPKAAQATDIPVAEAYQRFQQGAFFLDVRSQAEFDQAHIANSTLIPLDELPNRLGELPRDQDIVVVCLSGHRSEEGMTILRESDFSRAQCMTGGLTAWDAAGYPLESSSP